MVKPAVVKSRLVPERTVDSLFAVETVRHHPHALIWSPTQYRDSWDHEIAASAGEVWVIECKAVIDEASDGWYTEVDRTQLDAYLREGVPAVYVFLTQPHDDERPFNRPCSLGECRGGHCEACCYDVRFFSNNLHHVRTAHATQRLQPWFCHWAWTIDAVDLHRLMDDKLFSPRGRPRKLCVTDTYFTEVASKYGAERLCHFLSGTVMNTRFPDQHGRRRTVSGREIISMLREVPVAAGPDSTSPLLMEASDLTGG